MSRAMWWINNYLQIFQVWLVLDNSDVKTSSPLKRLAWVFKDFSFLFKLILKVVIIWSIKIFKKSRNIIPPIKGFSFQKSQVFWPIIIFLKIRNWIDKERPKSHLNAELPSFESSTVAENTPPDPEVAGLNPPRSWVLAFSFPYSLEWPYSGRLERCFSTSDLKSYNFFVELSSGCHS